MHRAQQRTFQEWSGKSEVRVWTDPRATGSAAYIHERRGAAETAAASFRVMSCIPLPATERLEVTAGTSGNLNG